MNEAFISYARQDVEIAQSVNSLLQKSSVDTFFDVNDLTMGMEYTTAITKAIRTCRIFVAIVSESSLNSRWCRKEIDEAVKNKKPIVCINIGNIDQVQIPYDLHGLQFVDYDALLEEPQQLIQIINKSTIHTGDSAPSIPSMIDENFNEHSNGIKAFKPKKGVKTWLKWLAIIVAIVIMIPFVVVGMFFLFLMLHPMAPPHVMEQDESITHFDDTIVVFHSQEEIEVLNREKEIAGLQRDLDQLCRYSTEIGDRRAKWYMHDVYMPEIIDIFREIEKRRTEIDSINREIIHKNQDEVELQRVKITQLEEIIEQNNDSINKLRRTKNSLLIVLLIVFLSTMTLMVFLIRSHRTNRRLNTDLSINSDAKAKAKLGSKNLIIEKETDVSLQLPLGVQKLSLNYSEFNSPKRINCFIAGSTALQAERDALRATISLVCNRWKEKNFQIFSFTYEDFERKFAPNGQQSLYDYFIENEANVAIFLIKGDVGDFTLTEFDKAYKSFKTSKQPSIIVYYDRSSELSPSAIELKNRVHSIGQYWVDYNTLNEMKYHFQEVLSTDLWTLYEKELSAK